MAFAFCSPSVSGEKKYRKLLFGHRRKKRNFPSLKKKPLKKNLSVKGLVQTFAQF